MKRRASPKCTYGSGSRQGTLCFTLGLCASLSLFVGCGEVKDQIQSLTKPAAKPDAPAQAVAPAPSTPKGAVAPSAPKGAVAPAKPPAADPAQFDCFADQSWSKPACQGQGSAAPPPWWGPKRWPSLTLQKQASFKDAKGRLHFSLTFVRADAQKSLSSCLDSMRQSLQGRFSQLKDLPSSLDTRGSFRGQSPNYEVTVVCGLSAKRQALVNVDLRPLS